MSDFLPLRGLAAELARARRVLVITGAGMSADSGLPTYRGVGGLYDNGPTADGVPIEEALSGAMMRARPELTWKYLGEIEQACRGRLPNDGHRILAGWAPAFEQFTVLTQNVDGFHRQAGSGDLIEIHGNLHRLQCGSCPYETEVEDYAALDIAAKGPPSCPCCAGLLRPRVVLFGEALPDAELQRLYRVIKQGVDLVISIGTTSVFPYIAQPVIASARRGAATAEINPGSSEVSHLVRYRVREGAASALRQLRELLADPAFSGRPGAFRTG
jgi:NAD-dependent deacetylase